MLKFSNTRISMSYLTIHSICRITIYVGLFEIFTLLHIYILASGLADYDEILTFS